VTTVPSTTTTRPGFTLVELLVVVAIIGTLVALLLPAVQAARESARRTQCVNNLRQVGLAVWGSTDATGVFPAGYEVRIDPDPTKGNNGVVLNGFLTLILPYAEESTVEALYDYGQGFDHASNQAAVNSRVPIYVCPSSPSSDRRVALRNNFAFTSPDLGRFGEATDYFGVRNVIEGLADVIPGSDRVRGAFRAVIDPKFGSQATPEKPLKPEQVTDGTSKTVMLVEIGGRPDRYALGRVHERLPYYAGAWAGVNGEMLYEIDPARAVTARAPIAGNCFLNCHNFYTPYSFHPGGLNVMLCDGSVHFLREDTGFEVWLTAVQPSDGDVSEFPF
jgi:prepilin-type N-terminal cleavage/methylation domain-containing protein/prepilin-type processing-associated H-X9-DG protein